MPFQKARNRNVAGLCPLIGEEAAQLTVEGNAWQALGGLLLLLVCLPFGVWAQIGASPLLWIPAGMGAMGGLCSVGYGAVLAQRSGRVASHFLSSRRNCSGQWANLM